MMSQGCALLTPDVIIVEPATPVQLAQDVPDVQAYVYDSDGNRRLSTVTLRAGMYALTRSTPENKNINIDE